MSTIIKITFYFYLVWWWYSWRLYYPTLDKKRLVIIPPSHPL